MTPSLPPSSGARETGHLTGGEAAPLDQPWHASHPVAVAVSQANFRIAPLARPDLVERQPELLILPPSQYASGAPRASP